MLFFELEGNFSSKLLWDLWIINVFHDLQLFINVLSSNNNNNLSFYFNEFRVSWNNNFNILL